MRPACSTTWFPPSSLRRFAEMVVQRADGNPFFVEELVRTLIDQGVLERMSGGWTVRELARDLDVPDTVQAVLAARIDLLEPARRQPFGRCRDRPHVLVRGPCTSCSRGSIPTFARSRSATSFAATRAPSLLR